MISVIVPMYNSQDSIERCLRSIMTQTYKDLEIIVVDDGSTDNSKDIVAKLGRQDSRIKYIWKENGGVSDARNKGIDIACGEYICFVDSDDAVISKYVQNMFETIQQMNTDICMCGFLEVSSDKSIERILSNEEEKKLKGTLRDDLWVLRKFVNSPWLKLFKLQTIKKNGIRFDANMVTAEDQDFNYRYYGLSKTVSFVNVAGYVYYRNTKGLSRNRTRKCFENELFNQINKTKFMNEKKVVNGDLILAESICYIARRYSLLTDEPNTYKKTKERLSQADTLNKAIRLPGKRDRIIYNLMHRHLYLFIYLYMRLKYA